MVRVSFFDSITSELLKERTVPIGGSVEPPTPPAHAGYRFSYWDGTYTNVQRNEEVWTVYVPDVQEFLSIPVTKVWIAPAGMTLPDVTVRLLRDGLHYRSLTLSAAGGWTGSFDNLPRYNAAGRAYVYTVTENIGRGFTLRSVTGSAEEGFTITNQLGGEDGMLNVNFIDYDGTLLRRERVPYGGSATPPDDPAAPEYGTRLDPSVEGHRGNHTFTGWAGTYTNVTRNENVYARYRYTGGRIDIPDDPIPLTGGAVSNFGDCIE